MRRLCAGLVAIGAALIASTGATAQNVLVNPGFEELCTPASGWDYAGNVSNIDFYMSSGVRAIKMFGPFCCPLGYSSLWQDVPASAGDQWEASADAVCPDWDPLSWSGDTGSRAFVAVDYLDAAKNPLNGFQQYISDKLDHPTNAPDGVVLSVPASTAPAGTAYARLTLYVEQGNWVGGAVWWDDAVLKKTGGANALSNASFEQFPTGCSGSRYAGWVNFGNGQSNFGENTRTGDYAAKLFGGYYSSLAYSGWFQDVPTAPGTRLKAAGWARSSSTDSLQPVNDVFVGIEFYDAANNSLAGMATRSEGVPTPGDDVYRLYESGVAIAPPGTAYARCVILQIQFDWAGGATWWDDMELVVLCPSDYNGDGFTTGDDFDGFVGAFENGDASADFNGDGFTTGDDFDGYVTAFENGC